jgi:hypothetical protein
MDINSFCVPLSIKFDTINDVSTYYKSNTEDRHRLIYNNFGNNVTTSIPEIARAFEAGDGFGELPFCWLWNLLVKEMPPDFKFLEIGVYKGRVLASVEALSSKYGKSAKMYGITPLSNAGDKYSIYKETDYVAAIKKNFKTFNSSMEKTTIYKGLSNNSNIIEKAAASGLYDIIYIDGCHDYEVVCEDIANYLPLVRSGGYLVMDDASLYLEKPYGRFLGHPDVSKAARDKLDTNPAVEHLFAVGHNRVWRKI